MVSQDERGTYIWSIHLLEEMVLMLVCRGNLTRLGAIAMDATVNMETAAMV
jgi:hypothetical protein